MLNINKIYCMDCLEGLRQLDDECIDLIITDPPYNTGMHASNTKSVRKPWLSNFFNDNLSDGEYYTLIYKVFKNLFRVLKSNKAIYIHINWKEMGNYIYMLEKFGFSVKNVIVWDKIIHGLNYQNYAYTYELIIFAIKGIFFPNNKINGFYKDIWHIQRAISNEQDSQHETIKPIILSKIMLQHSSNEGDLILDPFCGSGTTLVACKQSNRNFIGFEISQEYVNIANDRLKQTNLITDYFSKITTLQ